jgi:O-antigen/teichoic acid export membrane protein
VSATTEQRVLTSTVAAYGSQLGRTALRLVADLLLARLVLPVEHGRFDLAWGIVVVASLCRDLGLPYQLVRDPRQPYRTVLGWQLGSGIAVTLALIAGAPLAGGIDAGLPAVLRALAPYVLLDALAVVPRIWFERQLAVGRLVAPELWRGAMLAVVSIALAAAGWGVWSFVAGELAGAALFAALVWLRVRGRLPLQRVEGERGLLGELLRRSMLLFVIALAANSTPQIGKFVVEPFAGTAMVGQYGKALQWAMRLQILVLPAFVRVFYPALVEYHGDRSRLVGAFRLGTVGIVGLEVLAAYFLFFNADVVMLDLVAGDNWVPAAQLLRILALLPLVDPLTRLGGELLKVRNEDRIWLVVVLLNLASLLGFGLLLASRLGAAGMAWAHYLMLGNLLMAWRVARICGPDFGRLVRDLLFVYALPLPAFLAAAWLFPAGSWARFAASCVAGALGALLLLARFRGPFRSFFAAPPTPAAAGGS